jgi:hypothetical protein
MDEERNSTKRGEVVGLINTTAHGAGYSGHSLPVESWDPLHCIPWCGMKSRWLTMPSALEPMCNHTTVGGSLDPAPKGSTADNHCSEVRQFCLLTSPPPHATQQGHRLLLRTVLISKIILASSTRWNNFELLLNNFLSVLSRCTYIKLVVRCFLDQAQR